MDEDPNLRGKVRFSLPGTPVYAQSEYLTADSIRR